MSKSDGKKWALGALIAGAAGYVAGVLTAPKSGKDTREDLKEAAKEGVSNGEKDLKRLQAQINDAVDEAKRAGDKLSGKAKEQLAQASDTAKKAAAKAKEVLSAAREGDSDDADLKKAVSEADKALKDLKSFLKK